MKILRPLTRSLAHAIVITLLFPLLAFAGIASDVQEGAQLTDPLQEVVFSSTGLFAAAWFNLDNRVLLVNGEDRTAQTSVDVGLFGSFTITYSPTSDLPLPQGDAVIDLILPYKWTLFWHFWDREDEFQLNVFLDSVAPTVGRISPLEGEAITDLQTNLLFSITDTGSGVDANSIQLLINGVDQTASTSFANQELIYTPTATNMLPSEDFQVEITAADLLGNQSATSFALPVEMRVVLSATPIALPQTAYAPVTIQFAPEVTTGNAIQIYRWDLDGDGTYERSDIIGDSYSYNYASPGDYTVSLEVTDQLGEVATGTVVVHILNKAPVVSAETSPSNGEVPLTVAFSVTASDNEGIGSYEWDFDGDGLYDYSSSSTGNTSHLYSNAGQYTATLRVTDGLGVVSTYSLPTTTVNASPPGSPTVTASTSLASGSVPLLVSLGATATDPLSHPFILWEWDFDGDGSYDYSDSQSATVAHTYDTAGTFYPRVRVSTDDSRTSSDVVEVKVANVLSLSRDLDTVDVALDEQAIITTTLGGTTDVQLVIEDSSLNVVRILVDWTERSGGSYDDIWAGLGSDGTLVSEGDYYAVLNYKEDGQTKRLDLRETRDTSRYIPVRTSAPWNFSPFDNDPMEITFTLPKSSEVTAFMGYTMSNTFLVTFMNRLPLGKGSHEVVWYGTNNEGVLIQPPPGKYFMFGVWAYYLADNGIYVKSGSHIQGVTAEPSIFDPTGHESGLKAKSKISFSLSGDATVELQITDAVTGTLAATVQYPDLAAGQQTIEWDGKDTAGDFLAPGKYRLGVRAIGTNGYRSLMEYTLQRIYY